MNLAHRILPDEPLTKIKPEPIRNSAEIARFPKAKLPDAVEDFGKACAAMIWATFPGRSQWDVALQAAHHLGTSPDTIDRVLGGKTKHPDPRLMFAILAIFQSKHGTGFSIGAGLEVRIVVTGAK